MDIFFCFLKKDDIEYARSMFLHSSFRDGLRFVEPQFFLIDNSDSNPLETNSFVLKQVRQTFFFFFTYQICCSDST